MADTKSIDPTDGEALHAVWVDAFDRTNEAFFNGELDGSKPRGDSAGMLAVARAVVPDGYMAVPVESLKFVLDGDQWDDDTYFRHRQVLAGLLPTDESEPTR